MTNPQRCLLEDLREEVNNLLEGDSADWSKFNTILLQFAAEIEPLSVYADKRLRPGLNIMES